MPQNAQKPSVKVGRILASTHIFSQDIDIFGRYPLLVIITPLPLRARSASYKSNGKPNLKNLRYRPHLCFSREEVGTLSRTEKDHRIAIVLNGRLPSMCYGENLRQD